jgi:hypothetical protein
MFFVLSGIFIEFYPLLVLRNIFIRHNEKKSVSIDRMYSVIVLLKLEKLSSKDIGNVIFMFVTKTTEFSK